VFLRVDLTLEARFLITRVVELGERIGDFSAGNEQLEAIGERGILVVAARERRDGDGKLVHEGRLDQRLLDLLLENSIDHVAGDLAPADLGGTLAFVFEDLFELLHRVAVAGERFLVRRDRSVERGERGAIGARHVHHRLVNGHALPRTREIQHVNVRRVVQVVVVLQLRRPESGLVGVAVVGLERFISATRPEISSSVRFIRSG